MTQLSRTSMRWWHKVLLITGGVIVALTLITLILRAFPGLVRGKVPVQRSDANTVIHVQFRPSNGDLFADLPGKIRPPEDDSVLTDFTVSFDADSFRIPALQADHYPIAAFGDSYTEGVNAAVPWTDRVAEILNVPVKNYGYRGYGPLEERQTVHEFAGEDRRTWILLGFYAGNDLGDANRSTTLAERSSLYLLPELAQDAADEMSTRVAAENSDHYDYPMPVIIGGNYYDMAFLTYYLWRQLAPPEGFAASKTFQIFDDSVNAIEQDTPDTCRALIFIPTKEQLYYPYIHPDVRQYMRSNAYRPILDPNGYLQLEASPLSADDEPDAIQHFNDQRDAVKTLIESKPGWHFIDLLPVFQQHVDAGELLYYPYDTHWNQDGHDLAAQTIAAAMQNVEGCPLE